MIEHWNGQQWSIVHSPDAVTVITDPNGATRGINVLKDIAAFLATDVWAVGYAAREVDAQSPSFPLVEHWNGSRWSIVHLPASLDIGVFTSVTAIAKDNVWAVGSVFPTQQAQQERPLIVHWDGQRWTLMNTGVDQQVGGELDAIGADAANDIWAAGFIGIYPSRPLMEHWNGTHWSLVATPYLSNPGSFQGVLAVSPIDAWAVGYKIADSYSSSQAIVEHWNGKSWSNVPLQQPEHGSLSGLATAGGKTWAVGSITTGLQGIPDTLIETNC